VVVESTGSEPVNVYTIQRRKLLERIVGISDINMLKNLWEEI